MPPQDNQVQQNTNNAPEPQNNEQPIVSSDSFSAPQSTTPVTPFQVNDSTDMTPPTVQAPGQSVGPDGSSSVQQPPVTQPGSDEVPSVTLPVTGFDSPVPAPGSDTLGQPGSSDPTVNPQQ